MYDSSPWPTKGGKQYHVKKQVRNYGISIWFCNVEIREGSFGHATGTQGTCAHRRHMKAICLRIDSGRQLAGCSPGANHLTPVVLNFVWEMRVVDVSWHLPSSLRLCNNNHVCLCIHTHKLYAKINNHKTNIYPRWYNLVLSSLYSFLIIREFFCFLSM